MVARTALGVSLLFAAAAFPGHFPLDGRVTGADSVQLDKLQVVFYSPVTRESSRAWLQTDGSFSISGLADGIYEVSLVNPKGDVIVQTTASVPGRLEIEMNLPRRDQARGPVSLYRLSHQVPPAALKLFNKAKAASGKEKHDEAMQHLDKALQVDPDFVDALHVRGMYALSRGHINQARALLSRAADLDTGSAALQADAAVADYAGEGFEACEKRAAAALRIDPAGPKPNYLKALALIRLGRPASQAAPFLEKAAPSFPRAAELLSQIRGARVPGAAMK